MLLEELDNALKRGARIRILTGNYLGIDDHAIIRTKIEKLSKYKEVSTNLVLIFI